MLDTSLMKFQDSPCPWRSAGMTMPQDFDDGRHRGLALERGRDRELDGLDLAGKLALLGIVELGVRAKGSTVKAARPCWIQVT